MNQVLIKIYLSSGHLFLFKKHVLEKKTGTSLSDANSVQSGKTQPTTTMTNEEACPGTSAASQVNKQAHKFIIYGQTFLLIRTVQLWKERRIKTRYKEGSYIF